MRDAYHRKIDYIRVSITDRCNLRCRYCMPQDLPLIPHADILQYEEILRLCAIFAGMGIRTVKVTGGDPLVRKGWLSLVQELKKIPGIAQVTLTTNGVLLEPHVQALAALGLGGVNISLDSLQSETYRRLTGRDSFGAAWDSLHRAVDAGLRVKLNCVPIRGINENEILDIARLAETLPIDVRFIEHMPTAAGEGLEGVPCKEILRLLRGVYPDLQADQSPHGFGPARYFTSSRLRGGIGIIAAISQHFCGDCNRLRLTGEGFLKLCLYHENGLDLRGMLRGSASDTEIEQAIACIVQAKPERHGFGGTDGTGGGIAEMSRIGG